MLTQLMIFLAFIASLVLPAAAVVGVLTYVRRTRHLQEALGDGSPYRAVLDSLDQVHVRLDAMSNRVTRLEESVRLDNKTSQAVQRDGERLRVTLGEGGG